MGKTIKVKASFTDSARNAEGPLTSAATSAITAAATCAVPTSYPGGATQLWTGKVTLGQARETLSYVGFDNELGALSNTMFTAGRQYTIDVLWDDRI